MSFSFRIIRVISVVFIVFLFGVVCFGFFLRSKYIVPVLMYHYVLDTEEAKTDKRIVKPETLEKQMRFLKVNNYNVISLEELGQLFKSKKYISRNTVVITFDDGHKDNYENVYPILKKYHLPATMFVIVGYGSSKNSVSRKHMNKEQMKEMSEFGLVTIGSHTFSHPHLPSVTKAAQLRKEIYISKKRLEESLNKPVSCFSYPVGGFNKRIRDMVIDAGYLYAVSTSPGLDYPNDDPFAIKRIRIDERAKNLFVFWFESSGFYKYFLEVRKKNKFDNNKSNDD